VEASVKQVAPGELELVRQFLNTHDVEDGIDKIAEPGAMRDWLAAHGLDPGHRLGEADVDRAIALREALRALLLANNGEPLDERAIPTLNAIAERSALTVHFDDSGQGILAPAGEAADTVLGELLAIVVRSMAEGTWSRLKACRADTCQWAFYDRSKNRSGTWCSMAICGNRAKARAYRSRQATAS
jgi:predicted RNA-binding Zn ribbon-like protein